MCSCSSRQIWSTASKLDLALEFKARLELVLDLGELMLKMLSIVRTNSPTSVRLGDGLGYISVWATPPNRLTFWDGAPSLISDIRAMPRLWTRCVKDPQGWTGARPLALWDRRRCRWMGWLPPLLCGKEARKRP